MPKRKLVVANSWYPFFQLNLVAKNIKNANEGKFVSNSLKSIINYWPVAVDMSVPALVRVRVICQKYWYLGFFMVLIPFFLRC